MENKNVCELECPKCHKKWGLLKFRYGGMVKPQDVTITAGKRRKFKNGDSLTCSCCGYEYMTFDVLIAITNQSKPDSGRTNVTEANP